MEDKSNTFVALVEYERESKSTVNKRVYFNSYNNEPASKVTLKICHFSECIGSGGSSQGACAQGFGTCCFCKYSIAHTHTYIEEGFMQKKKEKVVSAVWGAELFNSLPR